MGVVHLLLKFGALHADQVLLPIDGVLDARLRGPFGDFLERQLRRGASRLRLTLSEDCRLRSLGGRVANDFLGVGLDVDLDVRILVLALLKFKLVREHLWVVRVLSQVEIGLA